MVFAKLRASDRTRAATQEEEGADRPVRKGVVEVSRAFEDLAPVVFNRKLEDWLIEPENQVKSFDVGFLDEPYKVTKNIWDACRTRRQILSRST